MTECWHDYTKDPTSMNVLLDHRCFGQEDIVQCVKCGDKSPLFLAKGYMAAMRLATAALAECDKEIERFRAACTALAKGNMERDAEIERLRKLVDAAPDLLAALKRAIAGLDCICDSLGGRQCEACQGNAAIAKATTDKKGGGDE